MRPTDCPRCKPVFTGNTTLAREAEAIRRRDSDAAAREYINAALERLHTVDHESKPAPPVRSGYIGHLR